MTIQSTTSYVEYIANGSQDTFAIPFAFISSSHIHVYDVTDGLSAAVEYTQGVDFTVSGSHVVFGTDPDADTSLLVRRITPITQETDYPEGGDAFPAESHEAALDKLTMISQENADKLILGDIDSSRFMTLSDDSDTWAARSKRIANLASASAGTDAVNRNDVQALITGGTVTSVGGFTVVSFTGDGSTTDFPTSLQDIDATDVLVYNVGGAIQVPITDYGTDNSGNPLTGTVFQFTTAPASGQVVKVLVPTGTVLSTLSAISLTDANFAADSIDPVMLESGTNGQALFTRLGATVWDEIVAADIADLDAAIAAFTLDGFSAPAGDVSFGSVKITDLADGTASDDAATVGQLALRKRTKTFTKSMSGSSSSKTCSATAPFNVGGVILSGSGACSASFGFDSDDSRIAYVPVGSEMLKVTCDRSTSGANNVIAITVEQYSGTPSITSNLDIICIEGDN